MAPRLGVRETRRIVGDLRFTVQDVIDKITAVRMHGLIEKHWRDHVRRFEGELSAQPTAKSASLWKTSSPG